MEGLKSGSPRTKRINLMTQKKELRESWLDLHHCARHRDASAMYQISNTGKVRKRTLQGFKEVKPHVNPEGYYTVRIKNSIYAPQTYYLHRLVAVTFIPNPHGYDTVDHIGGGSTKHDNSIRNLQWVSRADNISKAHEDGSIRRQYPRHPVKISKGNREQVFPTMSKCAAFLECSLHAVQAAKNGFYRVKGWKVESLAKPEISGNLFNDNDF